MRCSRARPMVRSRRLPAWSRETVWRWRHSDEHFIAALNLRRAELWRGTADSLPGLVPKAAGVRAAALDAPSAEVRLNAVGVVLRAAGLASGPLAPGSIRTTRSTPTGSARQSLENAPRRSTRCCAARCPDGSLRVVSASPEAVARRCAAKCWRCVATCICGRWGSASVSAITVEPPGTYVA